MSTEDRRGEVQGFEIIPPAINNAVDVLGLPPEQSKYLKAYHTLSVMDKQGRDAAFPTFVESVMAMRKSMDPDNPMSHEVSDKMNALIMASERTWRLAGDQEFTTKPNFPEKLAEVAVGLVDEETKFMINFRKEAEMVVVTETDMDNSGAPAEKLKINMAKVLSLTAKEADYLNEVVNRRVGISVDQTDVARTATALRREISPENPMSPEASDRLQALNLAHERIAMLAGDQLLLRLPNFEAAIKKVGEGLVDKETKFVADFRTSLQ